MRPSIWSLVRIDQTCLGRSGGFAPVSFPLFHGTDFRHHEYDLDFLLEDIPKLRKIVRHPNEARAVATQHSAVVIDVREPRRVRF
jgi:hypothetical protein